MRDAEDVLAALSEQERELVRLMAEGRSRREIAARMGIGEAAIERIQNSVMEKLRVRH